MRVAIYARKSKLTDQGESITNQITLCTEHINHKYPDASFTYYQDEGFSGGNANRPAFIQLMSAIKSSKIDVLICYRLDRISRNVLDFSKILDILTTYKVEFISIRESFDTSTPMGRAMIQIASVFAELERATITERIRDNMLELAKTGRWLGGTTPLGYTTATVAYHSSLNDKHYTVLVLDESTAAIVKLIYDKYLETGSLSQLNRFLLQEHIQTVQGNPYRPNTLRNILSNPVYVAATPEIYAYFTSLGASIYIDQTDFNGEHGLMVYNKNNGGKYATPNAISEWIVSLGEHTPIIDSSKWLDVQHKLRANSTKAIANKQSNIALLSGLLRCSKCGSPMTVMGHDILKDGTISYSYRCSLKLSSKCQCCNVTNAKGHYLDRQIGEQLFELLLNQPLFLDYLHTAINTFSSLDATSPILKHLKNKHARTEQAIQRFLTLLEKQDSPELITLYEQKIKTLKENLVSLNTKIALHEKDVLADNASDSIIYHSILDAFLSLSTEQKRTFLKKFINKVEWDGKQPTLFLNQIPPSSNQ